MATLSDLLIRVGIDASGVPKGAAQAAKDAEKGLSKADTTIRPDVDDAQVRTGIADIVDMAEQRAKQADSVITPDVDDGRARTGIADVVGMAEQRAKQADATVTPDVDGDKVRTGIADVVSTAETRTKQADATITPDIDDGSARTGIGGLIDTVVNKAKNAAAKIHVGVDEGNVRTRVDNVVDMAETRARQADAEIKPSVDAGKVGSQMSSAVSEAESKAKSADPTITPEVDGDKAESGMDDLMGNLKEKAKGGAAALGAILVGGTFMDAINAEADVDKMAAALGLNSKQMSRLGRVAGKVFANNWAGSIGEASEGIAAVMSSLPGFRFKGEKTLERISSKALAFADIFDVDVTRAVQIAGQMMRTGFAKNADQAFDMLFKASQKVPAGIREDLLDAVDEYGPFFQGLGFSGQEAFDVLVKSSAKGMYGIDKAGDAVKEFGIRATDGSKTTRKAFNALGLDADTMQKKLLAGGETGSKAFQKVVSSLLEIEDPSERATTALALFGTPMEDLSVQEIPKFLKTLQTTGSGFDDFSGAADKAMTQASDNTKGSITSIINTVRNGATDIISGFLSGDWGRVGKGLTAVWNGVKTLFQKYWRQILTIASLGIGLVVGVIVDHWDAIKGFFTSAWGKITDVFSAGWNKVVDVFTGNRLAGFVRDAFSDVVEIVRTAAAIVQELWEKLWMVLGPPVRLAMDVVKTVVGAGMDLLKGTIGVALKVLKGLWNTFGDDIIGIVKGTWNIITGTVKSVFSTIAGLIKGGLQTIKGIFHTILAVLKGDWKGAWNGIKEILSGVWTAIKAIVDNSLGRVKDLISNAWNKVRDLTTSAWNKVRDVITGVWNKIRDVVSNAVDKVRTLVDNAWDKIKTLTTNAWNKVRDTIDNVWTKIRNLVDNAVDKVRDLVDNAWTKVKTLTTNAWDRVKTLIDNAWTKVKTIVSNAVDRVKTLVSNAWDRVKTVTGNVWDAIRTKLGNVVDAIRTKIGNVWDGIKTKVGNVVDGIRTKIGNVWDAIRTKIKNVVDGIENIFDGLKTAIGKVPNAFKAAKNGIGRVWDGIKAAAAKPVNFVINQVYNNGIRKALNLIPGVDLDAAHTIQFATGGYTGPGPRDKPAGIVHADEYVIRSAARRQIEKTNPGFLDRLNKTGLPGHAKGGLVNPMKRVYVDGEPLTAVHAAQLLIAGQLMGTRQHVMQGSWQAPTSYSGTSHTGPGVADTSPGSFRAQWAQRRAGIAAWARNIPGAHYAGSGAHVHGVSMFSAPGNSQLASYKAGGDGLGGSDYGPRPAPLPGLMKRLKRFGDLTSIGGLTGVGLDFGMFGQPFSTQGSGGGFIMGAIDAIPDFLGSLDDIWDKIHDMSSRGEWAKLFAHAPSSVMDEVKKYGLEKIMDAGGWTRDQALSTVGKMGVRAKEAWDKIKGIDFPGLGWGGIVKSPTLAMLGERGPEAVVPLPPGIRAAVNSVSSEGTGHLAGLAEAQMMDVLERIAVAVESGATITIDGRVVANTVTRYQRAEARGQRVAAGTAGWS